MIIVQLCNVTLILAGSDYSLTTYGVVFDTGSYTTTVDVPITDDFTAEPEELFYGTLTAVEGANVLISQSIAQVFITDNDGI